MTEDKVGRPGCEWGFPDGHRAEPVNSRSNGFPNCQIQTPKSWGPKLVGRDFSDRECGQSICTRNPVLQGPGESEGVDLTRSSNAGQVLLMPEWHQWLSTDGSLTRPRFEVVFEDYM
jgi:hypothetical protein